MKLIDASDLNSDPIVYYQHKYYPFLAIFFGLILPTWISSLWQDTIGGFFYAGVVARVICWHTTFSINSFAHLVGDQHFSLENTSRGNFLLAFVTNGEGWHNFHHQFPNDYRNGVNFFDYDPTKWLIFTSFMVGLASNLTSLPALEIERSRLEVLQEKLDARKSRVATDVKELELFNRMELNKLIDGNCHKVYLLIDGLVLDVTDFQGQHPGGSKLLRARRLKVDKFTDSTADFDGGLNIHTRSAKRQLKTFAIGFLV